MSDRLRRFKAEFFGRWPTLRVLRSSSSFTMGNWWPARSLNAWVWNRQMFLTPCCSPGRTNHSKSKQGNQVFCCVRDPLIIKVLDGMRQYFYAHLSEPSRCWKRWRHPVDVSGNESRGQFSMLTAASPRAFTTPVAALCGLWVTTPGVIEIRS